MSAEAQARARALVLGVRLGEAGALDGLGGLGDRQVLVAGDLDQVVVERAGRVHRVLHLLGRAPALRRALLEQAERVAVAVLDVDELRLLQSRWPARSSRHGRAARGARRSPAMRAAFSACVGRQRPARAVDGRDAPLRHRRGAGASATAATRRRRPPRASAPSATTTAQPPRRARRRDDDERSLVGVQGRVQLDARARARDRLDPAGQRVAAEQDVVAARELARLDDDAAQSAPSPRTVTLVPAVT